MAQFKQQQPLAKFYSIRNLTLIVLGIFILFFFNNAHSQNGSPVVGVGNIVKVKEKFEEMNKEIQKLIDNYKNGVIDKDELKEGIKKCHSFKHSAIGEFPDVWNLTFRGWHLKFNLIDLNLNYAKIFAGVTSSSISVIDYLKEAKKMKETVEAELDTILVRVGPNSKEGGKIILVIDKLKEMNKEIQKLIDDYKNGKIGTSVLDRRIDKVIILKYVALSEFPDVWGRSFLNWYYSLVALNKQLDFAFDRANVPRPSKEQVVGALEKAKKMKDKLERYLEQITTDSENSNKVEKVGSAWTPPTGETRIAAVGTVRDEKVMMTSRGGSIGGTVTLETEEGEELAVVVPDEDGHFTIDFGDVVSLAVASTLVLTQLDSEGNTETSTTVEYLPGTPPEVVGIPVVTPPKVPFIENNQLTELEGSNFGEAAEVVIIDEEGEPILQETVSASNSLNEYFTDAPVGSAEVFVRNDYGSSEPVEISVYEFSVRAGKMDLVRNETTNVTAVYDGLPEGTKIIFTNMSENVSVKPNGRGKTSGNETIFTVKKSTGEVTLSIKAKQAGGWVINYRLEFPVSE